MNHISESSLRSYVDEQVSDAELDSIEDHLRQCSGCSDELHRIRTRAKHVGERLKDLSPPDSLNTKAAWNRFRERQSKSLAAPWRQSWIAAALATVILIAAFSFEPVRVAASTFLRFFRAQQIKVVSFDPAQIDKLNRDFFGQQKRAQLEQLFSEHINVVTHGARMVTTVQSEAVTQAGFGVRLPFSLGTPYRFEVQPAADVSIFIDTARIRTVLADAGREDIKIPDSLDGETIYLNVSPSLLTFYGDCPQETEETTGPERTADRNCKVLVQLPSPSIAVPPQLNERELGQSFLELLGMTPEQARALTENIDWAGTLLLPIPMDPRVKHTEVEVDGVNGVLIEHSRRGVFHLIWLRNGILYNLLGSGTAEDAVSIANTMS